MNPAYLWAALVTAIDLCVCVCVLVERHYERVQVKAVIFHAKQLAALVTLYADTCQSIGVDIAVESEIHGAMIKNKSTLTRNVLASSPTETIQ